jgi:DnaJ-class molecular chaperone
MTKGKKLSERPCKHCEGRGWMQLTGWPEVCSRCEGAGREALTTVPVIPTFMARSKTGSTTQQFSDPDRSLD